MNLLKTYSDILDFGKHKDKTVEEVLKEDPSYLRWLVEETDRTDFDEDVLLDIEDSELYDPGEHLDMWDFLHDD